MGMDVYGKLCTPTEEQRADGYTGCSATVCGKLQDAEPGHYFRASVWWWHPLADYLLKVAPDLVGKIKHLHSNDGDGLNGPDAKALAAILRAELESGRTEAYANARKAKLDALPDMRCELCGGKGKRTDMVVRDGCNGCKGTGKVRPSETWYGFDVGTVREFATFLEHSNGFEIC